MAHRSQGPVRGDRWDAAAVALAIVVSVSPSAADSPARRRFGLATAIAASRAAPLSAMRRRPPTHAVPRRASPTSPGSRSAATARGSTDTGRRPPRMRLPAGETGLAADDRWLATTHRRPAAGRRSGSVTPRSAGLAGDGVGADLGLGRGVDERRARRYGLRRRVDDVGRRAAPRWRSGHSARGRSWRRRAFPAALGTPVARGEVVVSPSGGSSRPTPVGSGCATRRSSTSQRATSSGRSSPPKGSSGC